VWNNEDSSITHQPQMNRIEKTGGRGLASEVLVGNSRETTERKGGDTSHKGGESINLRQRSFLLAQWVCAFYALYLPFLPMGRPEFPTTPIHAESKVAASPVKQSPFGQRTLEGMETVGIAEGDALDVYYHGSIVKNNMMVRKHNGYRGRHLVFCRSGHRKVHYQFCLEEGKTLRGSDSIYQLSSCFVIILGEGLFLPS
jgi:hypothetical protein